MDFSAVTPAIVILVYVFGELMKAVLFKDDKRRTLLPILCIIAGIIISVLVYIFYPQGMSANNFMDAIATGGLSGIAATGCNQLWKQFQRYNNTEE